MQDQIENTREGILEFPCGVTRLPNGNTLICDAGGESGSGSELLEVDPAGQVVFRWDGGAKFLHGVAALSGGTVALADTTNNRVIEIDRIGRVLWSSEQWAGGTGNLSDGSRLSYPNHIAVAEGDHFIVTDRNNDRFLIVDRAGEIKRSFSDGIKHPHNCELLPDGNIIIANSDNDSIDIIDSRDRLVWRYQENLRWPRDANLLPGGNVLVTDSKNSRVIEVTPDKTIAWEYQADHFANFYEAHRLDNGNTLISDQQHQQVIEVSPAGGVVWSFRNFRRETPVYDRLFNGTFKKWTEAGLPEGWLLATRLSEGGGTFSPGQAPNGRKVPGMTYDRHGALCMRQTVAVQPGAFYTLGGELATDQLDGFACLQVAFTDAFGGLLTDAALAPRGREFTGTTGWTQDSLEVEVPTRAVNADIRIFMTGPGKVLFRRLRFFC